MMVAVAEPPVVTLDGEKLTVTPAGRLSALSAMLELDPLTRAVEMVDVP